MSAAKHVLAELRKIRFGIRHKKGDALNTAGKNYG